MRKSGTHSARALGKKSAGKRGGRKRDTHAPLIALCALGAGILAASYGLTHQNAPGAGANVQASGIAAPKDFGKEIAGTAGGNITINAQTARKEDRLVTGSVPKQDEIAPPKTDANTKPQVAKKKKATTVAKTEAPKSFFDVFRSDNTQPKR
jgi:hypothetical protein